MKIERTLFWFIDGADDLLKKNNDFFELGLLLNRLLNEKYNGKKIKFLNLDFATDKTYENAPILPKGEPYYHGGHLKYYGSIDLPSFDQLNLEEQKLFLWKEAYKAIKKSAEVLKNGPLGTAAEYAFQYGVENALDCDFKVLEKELEFDNKVFSAAVWIKFDDRRMYSSFSLDYKGVQVFEKFIDETEKGIEYFLSIYKGIDINKEAIIIKGRSEIDYLPMSIDINSLNLNPPLS